MTDPMSRLADWCRDQTVTAPLYDREVVGVQVHSEAASRDYFYRISVVSGGRRVHVLPGPGGEGHREGRQQAGGHAAGSSQGEGSS